MLLSFAEFWSYVLLHTEIVLKLQYIENEVGMFTQAEQVNDMKGTPATNTRLKTMFKVCYCVEHWELKLHLPARV